MVVIEDLGEVLATPDNVHVHNYMSFKIFNYSSIFNVYTNEIEIKNKRHLQVIKLSFD